MLILVLLILACFILSSIYKRLFVYEKNIYIVSIDVNLMIIFLIRFLALAIDLLVVFLALKYIAIYKVSTTIIAIIAATLTALFAHLSKVFIDFSNKCKERYDDLVFLDIGLNINLTKISDNIYLLKSFIETPIKNKPILLNPILIETNEVLIQKIWNISVINKLVDLLVDYRKINGSMLIIRRGYGQSLDLIFNESSEATRAQQIVSLNEDVEKSSVRDMRAFLTNAMEETELAIAQIRVIRDYLLPNSIKYLFWFVTDWAIGFNFSFKGMIVSSKYISEKTLLKEAETKYVEFKKDQKEKGENSKRKIQEILESKNRD